MVHYKFTYFYFCGLGESIRYLFHYAGVPFEDDRLQLEDWTKHKPNMPMGQVPVLYVDGKELCQSMAIARYLAKEFGLLPTDNFQAAKADMIVDGFRDQYPLLAPMFPALRNGKDEDARKIWNEYKEKHMKPFLDLFEKFLTDNGGQFFVGDKISWVDVFVAERLDYFALLNGQDSSFLDGHKNLAALVKRINDNPNIKKYVAGRPATKL